MLTITTKILNRLAVSSSLGLSSRQGVLLVAPFSSESGRLLKLNELSHIEGSVKKRRRWGRGIGSGRGKMSGHGHQKSRSTPRGFEGGQTPMYKRLPKIGFYNPNEKDFATVNLDTIQRFIDQGRLQTKPNSFVTIRDLVLAGIVSDAKDGVKVLARGKEELKSPVHLEVSRASAEAIKAIESAGGTVTCTHFNTLALRALIKPYKFNMLPLRARPSPKDMQYYLEKNNCGYLSPEVQQRNLKLFGYVTSETPYREEHQILLEARRKEWDAEREEKIKLLKEANYKI